MNKKLKNDMKDCCKDMRVPVTVKDRNGERIETVGLEGLVVEVWTQDPMRFVAYRADAIEDEGGQTYVVAQPAEFWALENGVIEYRYMYHDGEGCVKGKGTTDFYWRNRTGAGEGVAEVLEWLESRLQAVEELARTIPAEHEEARKEFMAIKEQLAALQTSVAEVKAESIRELVAAVFEKSLDGYAKETDLSLMSDRVAALEVEIVAASGSALAAQPGRLYRFDQPVGELAITLPEASDDATAPLMLAMQFEASDAPSVTFSAADAKQVDFYAGFAIEASKRYEINAMFNGKAWVLAYATIQ